MCIAAEVKSSKLLVIRTELAPHLFPFKIHHFKVSAPNTTASMLRVASPHPWVLWRLTSTYKSLPCLWSLESAAALLPALTVAEVTMTSLQPCHPQQELWATSLPEREWITGLASWVVARQWPKNQFGVPALSLSFVACFCAAAGPSDHCVPNNRQTKWDLKKHNMDCQPKVTAQSEWIVNS